jgi:hypothetical protein
MLHMQCGSHWRHGQMLSGSLDRIRLTPDAFLSFQRRKENIPKSNAQEQQQVVSSGSEGFARSRNRWVCVRAVFSRDFNLALSYALLAQREISGRWAAPFRGFRFRKDFLVTSFSERSNSPRKVGHVQCLLVHLIRQNIDCIFFRLGEDSLLSSLNPW